MQFVEEKNLSSEKILEMKSKLEEIFEKIKFGDTLSVYRMLYSRPRLATI